MGGGGALAVNGQGLASSAGRVSFSLGLQGPCFTIDSASSSAMVALHLASCSLRLNECNLGLVLGVHLMFTATSSAAMAGVGIVNPGGRCYTWDERASGIVLGEACAAATLEGVPTHQKPNRIIVLGSSVQQDGKSATMTAPNGQAQRLTGWR